MPTTDRTTMKILVAEDDADDRFLIREAFETAGVSCDLKFAKNGTELLAQLQQGPIPPDLILLDLNMPGRDGREILADRAPNPFLAAIPLIVLTTSSAQPDIEAAYAAGAFAYVVKPDNFEKLQRFANQLKTFWQNDFQFPVAEARQAQPLKL